MELNMNKWICYAVGYVFITSGILKLLVSDFANLFINLGLPFPEITLYVVAITEVACGMLIAGRMYLKYALAPLILVMLGALYLTKIPVLLNDGFLSFAFDARLDIVMLILLLLIWQHTRGKVVA
ncbi:putative membrane protein YphA (DoxX/SURF4 family) [Virgibacillus natechei]|uniref:Membrane protein YphA (DoxX/SURF4 family) n=1 Tax=Virgibacillus natechei TaxID=1216297 RepID=A0ABS4IK00_9BACI|nr:DoxX family protein [Virgibacillus natechei]MBP1971302.1 putative membrane protein YphA (DoxX/SURF4 family) [Virgibacillus natechei]UZD12962.1 DoxX family protein [Virgibacillus natechei]